MPGMHRLFRRARNFELTGLPAMTREELGRKLTEQALGVYREMREALGKDLAGAREREILIRVIDLKWGDHLYAMDQLRRGMALRSYGRIMPVHAYIREGRQMFDAMRDEIRSGAVTALFASS